MPNIVQKCIAWNAARYDQVYDRELACKLLTEETLELFATHDPIERLDAIGDIIFVAIGVFWKLGLTTEQIEDLFGVEDEILKTIDMEKIYVNCDQVQSYLFDILPEGIDGAYPGIALATYCSFLVALGALSGMGMQVCFYDVCMAICDSNDTKEVKGKTDPTIKANVVKGDSFVPPTQRLEEIYEAFHLARKTMGAQNNE